MALFFFYFILSLMWINLHMNIHHYCIYRSFKGCAFRSACLRILFPTKSIMNVLAQFCCVVKDELQCTFQFHEKREWITVEKPTIFGPGVATWNWVIPMGLQNEVSHIEIRICFEVWNRKKPCFGHHSYTLFIGFFFF